MRRTRMRPRFVAAPMRDGRASGSADAAAVQTAINAVTMLVRRPRVGAIGQAKLFI